MHRIFRLDDEKSMLFIFNELIWDVIKSRSSWVKSSKLTPFGKIYLNLSWLFSQLPFWKEAIASQKKRFDLISPESRSVTMPWISVNSLPL